MLRVFEDVANSVLGNGFDALILVNGHGGNSSIVDTVVSSTGAEHGDVELGAVTYFHLAAESSRRSATANPAGWLTATSSRPR